MSQPTKPTFARLPLTDLVDEGVLAIANRRFFWPLGLALTWASEDGQASDLHIRQWNFADGHIETIEADGSDGIMARRVAAFEEWRTARLARMPSEERALAEAALPVPALDALRDKLEIVAKYLDERDDHLEDERNADFPSLPFVAERFAQRTIREAIAALVSQEEPR